MRILRSSWRFLLLLVHIALGAILTVLYAGILRRSINDESFSRVARWWLGRIPKILGAEIQVYGEANTQATMMVGNHVSWLDIPVLGGIVPVRFLSKQEVQNWPVVGWLADKNGTLYIERGRKGAAQEAADTITRSLHEGNLVLVFPEGTTSDGTDVLRFHARLFASAIEAEAMIQPVALRYLTADGELNAKVPYIGEDSMMSNLLGILPDKRMKIEVHFLEAFPVAGQSRSELASRSEEQVRLQLMQPLMQPLSNIHSLN